jgi:hypothetical protein
LQAAVAAVSAFPLLAALEVKAAEVMVGFLLLDQQPEQTAQQILAVEAAAVPVLVA